MAKRIIYLRFQDTLSGNSCEIKIHDDEIRYLDTEGIRISTTAPDYIEALNSFRFDRWKEAYDAKIDSQKREVQTTDGTWELEFCYEHGISGVIEGGYYTPSGLNKLLWLLEFIQKYKCEVPLVTKKLDAKMTSFIKESIILLRILAGDKDLSEWCRGGYVNNIELHANIYNTIYDLFYGDKWFEIVHMARFSGKTNIAENDIFYPTEGSAGNMSKAELIHSIIRQVSTDHICEGSLIECSIGKGYLLTLFEAYLKATNFVF